MWGFIPYLLIMYKEPFREIEHTVVKKTQMQFTTRITKKLQHIEAIHLPGILE